MISEFYKRPYKFKSSVHRAIIIACIAGVLTSLIMGYYDYTGLILIFYILIDFILNPNTVSITKSELIISKMYLAGLIKKRYIIPFDKILNVTSISRGILKDSISTTGIPEIVRGETYFSLFQLDYIGIDLKRTMISLNLHINEYNMLREILHTTL